MLKYLIIYIIFVFFILKKTITITMPNFFVNLFNMKIKVYGKYNLKKYNDLKIIIMSNHINATDYAIIVHTLNYFTNQHKKIYTIVKHDVFGNKEDNNKISNFFSMFKDDLYKKLDLIPYKRGDKKSGEEIKDNMLNLLENNNNILLFPEGECSRSGIPINFKPGSFRMCSENNIWILPISLKYKQNIGVNKADKINIKKWFNISTNVYIHKPVFDNNWEKLKDKVLNKIREPLK